MTGKFSVGDKVVPVSKSIYCSLEASATWPKAQKRGQNFMYVTGTEEACEATRDREVYVCSLDYEGVSARDGDFFSEEDLIPYIEMEGLVKEDISTRDKIAQVYDGVKDVVLYKNGKYGNSALEPIGIFYKGGAESSIRIRLDDKLMRVKNATELRKNDTADLLGYLGLLCVENNWLDFSDLKD